MFLAVTTDAGGGYAHEKEKGELGIGQRLAQKWAILHNAYLFASLIAPNA